MRFEMPYKTYLSEQEIPESWLNLQADLAATAPPLLSPSTAEPLTAPELGQIFCSQLAEQELDRAQAFIAIPQEVLDFYRMYRPSPLIRAYFLERELGTPAKIFYKYEGGNTSGSHKLNSAIAQAYYAKEQGLQGVATETGAGQWGTALSMACAYFNLACQVFMVKCSLEQKPYRRVVMNTYGAQVTASPSGLTQAGRQMLASEPDCAGSLGTAISEAVEFVQQHEGYRYVLGSVLNQVILHQSIIGLEAEAALRKLGLSPDIVIGCAGGGSNLGGLIAPFMRGKLQGKNKIKFIAIEPDSCPSLTQGEYRYDHCDLAGVTPLAKMYTLGHKYMPAPSHAGGLRFHGMSPLISHLYHQEWLDEARAVDQLSVFAAATLFARTEGLLPAPESAHAIQGAITEALRCKAEGKSEVILFGLTGTGNFDLQAYDSYQKGLLG